MNFEPKVLESIKKHDREVTRKKVLLLLPFLLALLAALLILIVTAARVQPFTNTPIPESRYLYETGTPQSTPTHSDA